MASSETLDALRENLIAEITLDTCIPCKKQHHPIAIDDPAHCACRCEKVEPLLERLSEIERAIAISDTYLNNTAQPHLAKRKSA